MCIRDRFIHMYLTDYLSPPPKSTHFLTTTHMLPHALLLDSQPCLLVEEQHSTPKVMHLSQHQGVVKVIDSLQRGAKDTAQTAMRQWHLAERLVIQSTCTNLRLLEQVHGLQFFRSPLFFQSAGAHVTEVQLQQSIVHNIR